MELTEEMQKAIELIGSVDQTALYVTGKAGTGKTTLLRLREDGGVGEITDEVFH